MKEIALASCNTGKIAEFREMFGIKIVTPKDLGVDFDVEETGATFYDNALLKARALYDLCGIPSVADDSGLCVAALDGAPGVFSARYSGKGDAENIKKLLGALDGATDRSAYFACCIVYYDGVRIVDAMGYTYGHITEKADGDGGFGYDPIFYSDDLKKTFGRATEAEKNAVSHRSRALSELKIKLKIN